MEVVGVFWLVVVVVLSFGATVVAGQNGLLSARCAARCLTEHKDTLRGGTRHRRGNLLEMCESHSMCAVCLKPCGISTDELSLCDKYCKPNESECEKSCQFLSLAYAVRCGTCPSPDTARGFEAACVVTCSKDGDCEDNKKCCPNSCGGVTCRQPVYTEKDNLPPIPHNLTLSEQQEGRSLQVSWNMPPHGRGKKPLLYVLENRNTTSARPNWELDSQWNVVLQTQHLSVLIRKVHAGHWYQYRVASVTVAGSQGFSPLSPPYKSSRDVERPEKPRNMTEGATTLRSGLVDVMISWQPPKYSDLPIWRYIVSWSPRLSGVSHTIVRLDVLQRELPADIFQFKLKRLKPGTTYFIQIEAVVKQGNKRMHSKKASMYLTTFAPPDYKPVNPVQNIPIHAKLKIHKLRTDTPYFHQGALKTHLSWRVSKAMAPLVRYYIIHWLPESCDQDYPSLVEQSATTQMSEFEVYDLLYECEYTVNVSAVTRAGAQGKPTSVKLKTPLCIEIKVKGDSLPPSCPDRPPRRPRQPAKFTHRIVQHDSCDVDIELRWKTPYSDSAIIDYLLRWGVKRPIKELRSLDNLDTRQQPVEIQIANTSTEYVIKGLKTSEHYFVTLYARSDLGLGEPVYVEIWTPEILPCGSDKDPVPPDKGTPTVGSTITTIKTTSGEITSDATMETTCTQSPSSTQSSTHQREATPKLDIYKTIFYMFLLLRNIFVG